MIPTVSLPDRHLVTLAAQRLASTLFAFCWQLQESRSTAAANTKNLFII
jgi:hypothetical protein